MAIAGSNEASSPASPTLGSTPGASPDFRSPADTQSAALSAKATGASPSDAVLPELRKRVSNLEEAVAAAKQKLADKRKANGAEASPSVVNWLTKPS